MFSLCCQETIKSLQENAEESGHKVAIDTPSIPEIINFKIQAAETKSHAKVCTLKYAVQLQDLHISIALYWDSSSQLLCLFYIACEQ